MKGILLWAGFFVIAAAIWYFSRRIRRQIETDGIETDGVISAIRDEGSPEEIDLRCYARYRTADGEEVEGLVLNPPPGLEAGQRVRLRYHPKLKTNARIVAGSGSDQTGKR